MSNTNLEERMSQRQRWTEKLEEWRVAIENALCDKLQIKATVRVRVKSVESLVAKMRGRAEGTLITDLLGMRIVVPFLSDVEKAVDYLRETQRVMELDRKANNLSSREFGYNSVHLLLRPEGVDELDLPEGCSRVVEVQVRTTLQDAWAEVEHELIYKNTHLPGDSMRKKMAAINATLTLSDIIFQEIRDQQKELERQGHATFGGPNPEQEHADETQFRQAASTAMGLELLLRKALTAHNKREYDVAAEHYTEALKLATEANMRSVLFNHRGLALAMLGRNHEALRDYGSSLQLDPNSGKALTNRGILLRRLGYLEEAIADFERSVAVKKGVDVPGNLFLMAQTYQQMGKTSLALEKLREALELDPTRAEAKDLLRTLLTQQG
ncbi:MAG: tetratricopeptide repeat protein [Fibrobacterales bacterium]|nr:tetratricopeptide repeat protein [Fibrobacterales bacterium]MBO7501426.1 tetratricopeptide repeat protein [Fibrobacterales bacterium]MBP5351433.1 tetratricopeptide repeat protein [Fibrobacterales bacterium]